MDRNRGGIAGRGAAAAVRGMNISPADISPHACEDFYFQDYEKIYLKNAPVLFGLIQTLCCVTAKMDLTPIAAQRVYQPIAPPNLDCE
jgi:hypothetical protein